MLLSKLERHGMGFWDYLELNLNAVARVIQAHLESRLKFDTVINFITFPCRDVKHTKNRVIRRRDLFWCITLFVYNLYY